MMIFFRLTAESVSLMPRSYNTNLSQFWPERPSYCFLWYLWTSGKERFRQWCLHNEKSWILCLVFSLPSPSYRDLVHRQTASAVVQHMSLGVYGFGCEDSLNHLLNYVWPNVFETSPHVIQAVMGALEGLRVAIGPCRMLQYCLQVRPPGT